MKQKILSLSLFMILVLVFIPAITFSRSMISGQVVDAETGEPIENAVFYINWWKVTGIPGLTSSHDVETDEGYTDAEGYFKIPKYSTYFKEYRMAVYKKGYVCWRSDKIFPTLEDRKNFKLKNKMIIKLEKFKEEYSKEDHARFTNSSQTAAGPSGVFDDATRSERELERESYKTKKGE